MRTLRLLMLTSIAFTLPTAGAANAVVATGEFHSIEARNGAHVTVRYGAAQSVSVIGGDDRCTQMSVSGKRLRIDRSGSDCRHDRRSEIEVVTPALSAVSVAQGGWLRVAGGFPAQASIDAAVEQGGALDIRAIAADRITASVYSGGRIFASARMTLTANIESGGVITYWGEPEVRKTVRGGGVVSRGSAEDAEKPFSDLAGPALEVVPIPPIPPIPPVPPLPR